ncbi:LysR family transcriptional regulator [Mangrovihabitans endophyticus]|nr:LysR family transcriptional regulator [Mangrovihabitans endophyticus]
MEPVRLDLRHLEYFAVVAEEQNFRRAAMRLHIAQPGLSQRIKRLERVLGLRLFDRTPAGARLTDDGAALLPLVREALDGVDRVTAFARNLASGRSGRVRVGYTRSAGPGMAANLITGFRAQNPAVSVTTSTSFTAGNLRALAQGEIDVGFVRPPLPARAEVVSEPLTEEPVVVAVHRDHPLARRRRLRRSDLAAEPLVFFPQQNAPGMWASMLDQVYGDADAARIVRTEPSEDFMLAAVAEGAGIALVTAAAVKVLRIPAVVIRRFVAPEPAVGLSLAWRRGEANSTVLAFVEFAMIAYAETTARVRPVDGHARSLRSLR